MWSRSRPAPPDGPPPAYAAVVRKVYPYSLRPIVIFTGCLGFIWAMVMGVNDIRDRQYPNASSKQQLFDLITAILYFVIALLEFLVVLIAVMQNLAFGRIFLVIAPLGFLVALAVQSMAVALHWTLKTDLINQCVRNTAGIVYNGNQTISQSSATDICNSAWDRGSWTSIVWLLCSLILAGMFASLAMSYYRQLLDPSSVRQRRARVETYAMQPNYNNYPPPPGQGQGPAQGQGQQGWMVPPYPGPPQNMPMPPPQGFEKSDYHPAAAWADQGAHREQEEAWARAQASGPTAHIGMTSPGRLDHGNGNGNRAGERGYVVGNPEEDEAWERARNEGVTAHLTGNGQKPTSPRKEQGTV